MVHGRMNTNASDSVIQVIGSEDLRPSCELARQYGLELVKKQVAVIRGSLIC